MKMMNKFEACQLEEHGNGQNEANRTYHADKSPQFWQSTESKPKTHDDENWEDRFGDDNAFCTNTVYVNQSKESELHFVDTDSSTDKAVQPMKKKLLPPRKLKTSSISSSNSSTVKPVVNNETTVYSPDPPSSIEIFGKTQYGANDYYSKQQVQEPHAPLETRKEKYGQMVESLAYNNKVPISQSNQAIVFPEKKSVVTNHDLADHFSSTLTFGDTQDLFDQIKEDITFSSKTPPKYPIQNQDYKNNQMDRSFQFLPENPQTRRDSVSSESAETDRILHEFLRRDPPASLTTNHGSVLKSGLPNEIFPLNNTQQYTLPMDSNFVENQQFVNGFNSGPAKSLSVPSNGQGSSSSLASDSPLQSPFGTPQSRQSSPFPINVQDNQNCFANMQGPPMGNQHNPSPVSQYSALPGYITPNPFHPLNTQMAGFPQYRTALPVMDITNPLYHAQIQNMIAMNMYQQAQLAARANEEQKANNSPVSDNEGVHSQNHQVLKNDTIPLQLQTQMQSFPIQSQPQINPLQSQILQPQKLPPLQAMNETTQIFRTDLPTPQLPKQEGYPQDYNQQPQGQTLQSQNLPRTTSLIHNVPPQQAINQTHQLPHEQHTLQNNQIIQQNDKTELQQELYEVMQRLQQIQQAMGCSQITSPPIPAPHQPPFVYPQPLAVPMNGYYPAVGVIPPAAPRGHERVSPTVDEQRPNMPGPQLQLEPHVGRGRMPH